MNGDCQPEVLYQLAVTSGSRGEHGRAARLLGRAIRLRPDMPILHGQLGNVLHAQGKHRQAVNSFGRALELAPGDPDHYNNLGNVFRSMRRLEDAIDTYRKGLALQPAHAPLQINLAISLAEYGEAGEAIAVYRRALAAAPQSAEALQGLANLLKEQGRIDESVEFYERLVDVRPEFAPAHLNLGIELQNQGKLESAVRCYRKVLEVQPELAAAHNNLGSALRLQEKTADAIAALRRAAELDPKQVLPLCNLAAALQAEKQWDEARACFERAYALEPENPEVCNLLGTFYSAQEDFDQAMVWYERALALRPHFPEVDSNIANVLRDQGRLDEAVERYQLAIGRKPELADAYNNLGNTLKELARYGESVAAYQKAIELKPDHAGYKWNQALTYLAAGDCERGWAGYEWGFACKQRLPLREFPHPRWEGQSLTGRTILTWGEQGVGDELMFAGCIPELAEAADGCVVECDPRLVTLFARSFPDCDVVPHQTPAHPRTGWPDIDLQVPMGSLPRWLRRSHAEFPRHRGYLKADPARVEYWKNRLAALGPGLKAGISWRSRLMFANRRKYYVPLELWDPILTTPGVEFVNLQYCEYADDIAAAEKRSGVRIHNFADLDLKDALDDVAALTSALDLVITIANINMDLGGALNTETWLFTAKTSQAWTTLGVNYVPWFPGVKMLTRDWNETWDEAVAGAAAQLAELTAGRGPR